MVTTSLRERMLIALRIRNTETYTHVSPAQARSPLDRILPPPPIE